MIPIVNRIFPEKKIPEDYVPQNWDWTEVLSKEEWDKVWKAVQSTPNFWETLKPLPGAQDLREFFAINTAKWYCITSRTRTLGRTIVEQTENWLRSQKIPIHRCRVIVANSENKWQYLKALEIPFYLDDYAPTVDYLQNVCKSTKSYLLDAPYNRRASKSRKQEWNRLFSVAEYLRIVKEGS